MPEFFQHEQLTICGCDEAGRGCLAGPVVAAAVILPAGYYLPMLNDSKQVKEKDRDLLSEQIRRDAIAYGIGMADNEEIDRINILKASFLAMHRAIDSLGIRPDLLIIDGNRFVPYPGITHQCHIKGDSKYTQISAASILAKTHRDNLMKDLSEQYPQYQWQVNKGYPTPTHRAAIQEFGSCPLHRMTFKLLPADKLELF